MNIEQIKADREAGTQGPWKVQHRKTPWELSSGKAGHHNEHWISTAYDHPQLKAPDPVVAMSRGIGTPQSGPVDLIWLREEDARRIARVPDLEDFAVEAAGHIRLLLGSFTIDERIAAQDFLKKYTEPD